MSQSFEKKLLLYINEFVDDRLEEFTPSLQVSVLHAGKKKANLQFGKEYRFYDWASLTKPVFAVSALIDLYQRNLFDPNDSVSKYLSWWPHKEVKIKQLLNHSAGLHWWKPIYKKIDVKKWQLARPQLKSFLEKEKIKYTGKSKYSDLDFWLLSFLLEELYQEDLLTVWQRTAKRLGFKTTHMSVNNKPLYARQLYAPTENCLWRKKVLKGEAHDDNTWALNGVSTHAGLFGEMSELMHWGKLLRNAYLGKRSVLGSKKAVRLFCRRSIAHSHGDWGLGLMKAENELGGGGSYFSKSSVGHTGFTGTSFWFDPLRDVVVCILSNRVHPSRDNKKFLSLRREIHKFTSEKLPRV